MNAAVAALLYSNEFSSACLPAQLFSSSSPAEDNKVSGAEREYVMANTVSSATAPAEKTSGGGHFSAPTGNATQIPWKLLLSRKEVGGGGTVDRAKELSRI
jgi:hypothetical protein